MRRGIITNAPIGAGISFSFSPGASAPGYWPTLHPVLKISGVRQLSMTHFQYRHFVTWRHG